MEFGRRLSPELEEELGISTLVEGELEDRDRVCLTPLGREEVDEEEEVEEG